MSPQRSQAVALGRVLRAVRTERHISQEHLALESGVTRKTISDVETAKVYPRLETLRLLAVVLGVRPGELLDRADELERRARRRR